MESGGIAEVGTVFRIEGGKKTAVGQQGAQGAALLRVVVAVAEALLVETAGVLGMAERLGQIGEGVVGDVVFQGVRNGVVARGIGAVLAHGHVAFRQIGVYVGTHLVVLAGAGGRVDEGIVGGGDVIVAQALQIGVGYHGY